MHGTIAVHLSLILLSQVYSKKRKGAVTGSSPYVPTYYNNSVQSVAIL